MGSEPLRKIDLYGSLDCPFAYLATFRLHRLRDRWLDETKVLWRNLALEYVNRRPAVKPLIEAEQELFARIEPELPYVRWEREAWDWPATMWPAAEALACAQLQGNRAALAMSWALRHAFFGQSRNIALRHVLMAIGREVAAEEPSFDVGRFKVDWDVGQMKGCIISESRRGWREMKLNGSATFVLPDGRRMTNPAVGPVGFDEQTYTLKGYEPFDGAWEAVYEELLGIEE